MKFIKNPHIIIVFIIVFMVFIVVSNLDKFLCGSTEIGTFLILGFTLIAVVIYTYETYRMANDTNRMAGIQSNNSYKPRVVIIPYIRQTNFKEVIDCRFLVKNDSDFYVKVELYIKLMCFGSDLDVADTYNGKRPWNLPPNQGIDGHFYLDKNMLAKIGKTIPEILEKINEENTLTLQLWSNCTSDYNIPLEIPITNYHLKIDDNTKEPCWVLDV